MFELILTTLHRGQASLAPRYRDFSCFCRKIWRIFIQIYMVENLVRLVFKSSWNDLIYCTWNCVLKGSMHKIALQQVCILGALRASCSARLRDFRRAKVSLWASIDRVSFYSCRDRATLRRLTDRLQHYLHLETHPRRWLEQSNILHAVCLLPAHREI